MNPKSKTDGMKGITEKNVKEINCMIQTELGIMKGYCRRNYLNKARKQHEVNIQNKLITDNRIYTHTCMHSYTEI
jgi:hypothetical protein